MLWICGAAMGFAPEWHSAALGLYAGAPRGAGVGLRHLRVLLMGAQAPESPSDGGFRHFRIMVMDAQVPKDPNNRDLGISRSW